MIPPAGLLRQLCLMYLFGYLAVAEELAVERGNGESSYIIPEGERTIISLEEHNNAFASSAYCLGEDGGLNGLNRALCAKTNGCHWKLREGFTTEKEWRAAVSEEMTRLHQGDGGQVGMWIVEAPTGVRLDRAFITELEASAQLSLRQIVQSSENHDRRYFVVPGTPQGVCRPLQAVGFRSCTPIPSRLKIHPALEENPKLSRRRGVTGASSSETTDSAPEQQQLGIQVLMAPVPSFDGDSIDAKNARANALAQQWSAVVATSVGHTRAVVQADGDSSITIQSLTREEVAATALSITARHPDVERIIPVDIIQVFDKYANAIVQGGPIEKQTLSYPLWDMGIHGENQIVGVADTGLDWNHCFFRDNKESSPGTKDSFQGDVWEHARHRKIRQYATWRDSDKEEDRRNGHGTAVCGVIAGTQHDRLSDHRGVAYEAKLAIFDIHPKRDFWRRDKGLQIPSNINTDLFPIPYKAGARIHCNAWGSDAAAPVYNVNARYMDEFMFNHQDFLIVVAAGNKGNRIASLTPEASAKNVITVGASENKKHPNDADKLTSYSSRGPTSDGRIKPDICAPGRHLTTAQQTGPWGLLKCRTASREGSSMSTAVVAGLSALVRQYFTEGYYPDGRQNGDDAFIPMGSLLKAVLVNGGQALSGAEAVHQYNVNVPNMDQGFGLAVVDSTLTTLSSPMERKLYVDGEWTPGCEACPGVNEGDVYEYVVEISPIQRGRDFLPLKVTLAWSDYSGGAYSNDPTVNDLDLVVVESTDGFISYANGGTRRDTKNNVEHVNIPIARPGGKYIVKVSGTNVVFGPQPYAIVISGMFEGAVTKRLAASNDDSSGGSGGDSSEETNRVGWVPGSSSVEGSDKKALDAAAGAEEGWVSPNEKTALIAGGSSLCLVAVAYMVVVVVRRGGGGGGGGGCWGGGGASE